MWKLELGVEGETGVGEKWQMWHTKQMIPSKST